MNRSVKTAAVFLWCYAALLMLEAVGMGVARDWSDHKHFIQHILVAASYFGLGWSVLRRHRWAWWVVVIVVGLISVLGLAGTAFVLSSPATERSGLTKLLEEFVQFGSLTVPFFVLSLAALVGSVVALLTKKARDAFFRP